MATTSTPALVSPLRQGMQHDMMMRGLLPRTQDQYIRHVRRFAAYLGRPPDTATAEDLRNFQIHQHESGASAGTISDASAGTINGAVSALAFSRAQVRQFSSVLRAVRRRRKMLRLQPANGPKSRDS